jgi:hypothetical protein
VVDDARVASSRLDAHFQLSNEFESAVHAQAYRDNGRLAVIDEAYAQQLWESTGLWEMCQGIEFEGKSPVGLNPNLRFYRYCVFCHDIRWHKASICHNNTSVAIIMNAKCFEPC